MKIQITFDPAEEASDPDDRSGLTAKAYEDILDLLIGYGDDIDIVKVEETGYES